ncbi:autotransporter assembly complex protein TamA [Halopseudomonas salegens]|uniref:Translocation and assembly module subunit TamA n=1 Tax=Halopseudomonas salegens TaxID=1434072 RepID=A0A1H2F6J4_9GAMM|nr:autotransporter assembly complex family protein [Halopseudomonas salegens]SDU02974.1 autotransporter secretion outer membrane protein TamA [Halopseudomonas salegens]
MLRVVIATSLLFVAGAAWAQLDVRVEPSNSEVRANIEAFIGELKAESRRDMWRLARHSREQAENAAQALGYYNARIRPQVEGPDDAPVLILHVQLGEPVRYDRVNIRVVGPGEGTREFALPSSDRLRSGETLHHGHYESLKSLIRNQALRYGYFSGGFSQQRIRVNPLANQADLDLVYRTGERYRLGEVTFTETPFNEDLLQRMVSFEPGTPYDADLIASLNRDLLSAGYFESVQVSAPNAQAVDGVIPVQADVQARKPHSLGFGGGFSTDVGPRARANWTQHWLNARGHSRGAEMELAGPRQNLSGYYQIPLTPPMSNTLRFVTGYQREDIDDVESQNLTVGAQWQRRLDSGWERVVGLRLEQEKFSVGNDRGNSTLLIPSLSFQRVRSSGEIDPTHGWSVQFDLQGAKEGVVSDIDFVRVNSTVKGLYTLADKHRFLGRVQGGAIASNSFSRVPPSLRFFAGGDQSVRGYAYRNLSPRDESGDRIGARYLATGTLEYQYEFRSGWRAATFVDHGNAVDSWDDPLKTSVGVGIRWVSPVGPIRFDVARSVSDPDEGFRLHFSMGPDL